MTQYLNDSIFWIEVEKIQPNPYQPRREFNQDALQDLADSIRQYGVLQPLVVTRKEEEKEDGGLRVTYELIAGERRLRASKIAGIFQVPTVIRAGEEDPKAKLEIAIIENLQREDLNPVDRAHAFSRLVEEFGFKHGEVAKKVGRSREYVSNTLRLLVLPEEILNALRDGKISEGHARTTMMLSDRPDEQKVLFKEIVYKKLSVREAEGIAREIAHDRVRKKKHKPDPELTALEGKLSNTLGTRVHIERKENGGKVVIDFFSNNDLEDLLTLMESNDKRGANAFMDRFIAAQEKTEEVEPVAAPSQSALEKEVTEPEVPIEESRHNTEERKEVFQEAPIPPKTEEGTEERNEVEEGAQQASNIEEREEKEGIDRPHFENSFNEPSEQVEERSTVQEMDSVNEVPENPQGIPEVREYEREYKPFSPHQEPSHKEPEPFSDGSFKRQEQEEPRFDTYTENEKIEEPGEEKREYNGEEVREEQEERQDLFEEKEEALEKQKETQKEEEDSLYSVKNFTI